MNTNELRSIRIIGDGTPKNTRVIVDETDITEYVSHISIQMGVGILPLVYLKLKPQYLEIIHDGLKAVIFVEPPEGSQ